MKTDIMLFVNDVAASSSWYQSLLGARSGHGGSEFEMIVDEEGALLFQLHKLDGEEHGVDLTSDASVRGAGVLSYVQVEDVAKIYRQALSMGAEVLGEPVFVSQAGHTEFLVKDPDGYSLAIYTRGNTAG